MLTFIRFLSKLPGQFKSAHLNSNIDLLLVVADPKMLLETIHLFTHLIPKSMKIPVMQNITTYCIKKNVNIQDCGFIKSTEINFKYELQILYTSNIFQCFRNIMNFFYLN